MPGLYAMGMNGMNILKGRGRLVFIGAVAVLVVLTFGVMLKGVYLSASDGPAVGQAEGQKADGQKAGGPKEDVAPQTAMAAGVAPPDARPSEATSKAAQSMASQFRVKRILQIDGPLRHGDFFWDDKDVPAGPLVITVDLTAQTLSVFRAGYEIGTAVILYGATDKPSPLGVFPISQKSADHVSNLYNAPMPYMLRLTNDGVAIHGSDVKWGNATHGCIGVPTPFAKKLFAVAQLGDPVIVTDGKMMQLN